MENISLAIVIPAYKAEFFRQTLDSLTIQTDKRFRVYIGDDCSPENLEAIVCEYEGRIPIVYKRFSENLGRRDLVAHWTRCLDLVQDEDFVCLFSDDDIMDKNCVKSFYECLNESPEYDVYHYNIKIIDAAGAELRTPEPFPDKISSAEFFSLLYRYKIDARMPEFIFRRSVLGSNGFISFPRAFRSDNATVIKCAERNGIKTITGNETMVLWRESGRNMSCSVAYEDMLIHSQANILFFNWLHRYFKDNGIPYPLSWTEERYIIIEFPVKLYPHYSFSALWKHLRKYEPGNLLYKISVSLRFLTKCLSK